MKLHKLDIDSAVVNIPKVTVTVGAVTKVFYVSRITNILYWIARCEEFTETT